ncbi:MAG: hypothetical protein IIX15_02495 [Clostridia bacterium]|nr:hypothetical protein [Clostridia bacterium]
MKKLLTLLLALVMIVSTFAFVSCGNDTPENPDVQDPGTQDPGTQDPGTQDPGTQNPGTEDPEISEDQKKADKVIDRINKIEEITADTWEDMENKIKYARKYYDELTDAQKALIDAELIEKLEAAEAAFAGFLAAAEKAEGLTVNKIVNATCYIDGKVEGYYVMGSALVVDGATVRFVYDKDYLYVFATVDGTDDVTVQIARNAVLVGGVVMTASEVKSFTTAVADAATAAYPYDVVSSDNGYIAEVAIPLADLGLEDDHFEDKEIGVTFACGDTKYAGYDSLEDCERFYSADSARYNYISAGTPTVDGVLDELYLNADAIELSLNVVKGYTEKEKKLAGGENGFQGDTSNADAFDTHTYFRFAVDDKYLYIVEHRLDMNPIYGSNDFTKPFRGDGSLLWFSKDDSLGAGIQWNRALKGHEGPQFGLFFNDSQGTGVLKNWEFSVKQYGTECEYIMEVKVPLKDLELTQKDFEEARVSFTFCTADMINPDYDPTNFAWAGNGYQMNYIGVNTWQGGAQTEMPMLLVNTSGAQMSEMPELTGDYAPEHAMEFDVWDPEAGIIPRPFETFPFDAEKGYFVPDTTWTIDQLMDWYANDYANSTMKYNLTRVQYPEYDEGISLIENGRPSWNNTGYFCDTIGSSVTIAVDLTKYKDALIVFATGQNNQIEFSTDNENWTEVYNYIKLYTTPTTDYRTRYGIAFDTSIFTPDAQMVYIRIGQARTDASGYGGALSGFTVLYN